MKAVMIGDHLIPPRLMLNASDSLREAAFDLSKPLSCFEFGNKTIGLVGFGSVTGEQFK